MKKLLFIFSFIFSATFSSIELRGQVAMAQDVFCEDFDLPQSQWKMNTYSIGSPLQNPLWWRTTQITASVMSIGAAADTCGDRTHSYLGTPGFQVDSFNFYTVSFQHIGYISQFDDGIIEYSFDSLTWTRLPGSSYTGNTVYVDPLTGFLRFNKNSNIFDWGPQNDTTKMVGQLQGTWQSESFNLSNLIAANRTPGPDTMYLRLGYFDNPSSPFGRQGSHIWYVDDFCVRGSDCDTESPMLTLQDPPNNYVERFEGRVYLTGPYEFDATITDNDGAFLYTRMPYFVKRDMGAGHVEIFRDTINLTNQGGGNFDGDIPRELSGTDVIQAGDSVYWRIEASDLCGNVTSEPISGEFEDFQVRPNLPPSCGTQPIFQFPYSEDFDGGDFNGNLPKPVALAPNNTEQWQNISGDFHDWTINTGTSTDTSLNNSPFRINDDFPGGGNYLYVESKRLGAGFFEDSIAFLATPCIDFTDLQNALVRFYVNMNTAGIEDTIRVDVFDPTPTPGFPNGRFVENVIPPITGNRGDNWLPFEFSTGAFTGVLTQFRFVGTPGRADGLSDMAIDSFSVRAIPPVDVRLNAINIEPFIPTGDPALTDDVQVNIQNLGVAGINQYDIQYRVTDDNGTVVHTSMPEPFTTPIPAGANMNLDLNEPYPVPLGRYTIQAWVTFAGDLRPFNDTTFINSRGLRLNDARKYMEDFDTVDDDWVTFVEGNLLDNLWQIGTPNFNFTYSAYTSPNSWDILLDRGYTGTGNQVTLFTPFMDFSNADDVIMSFINNRSITKLQDGVYIEYSMDRGFTWDSLTSLQDPNRIQWYNSFLTSGGLGGQSVLSGNTFCPGGSWAGGYLESELMLDTIFNNKPEVLFRFNFFAQEDDNGNDGISIDNFLLYDPEPLDLQVQHFLSPSSDCELTNQQRVEFVLKNRGLNTVSSFDVEYRATHVPTGTVQSVTDSYTRTVDFRDTLHVKSVSTLDLTQLGDYIIEVIAKLPNDQCAENDTLAELVENIDGCFLEFYIETSFRPNQQIPCDSTSWRFDYTSDNGRSYTVTQGYNWPEAPINVFTTNDTIRNNFICIRKNSQVTFQLNDRDTLVNAFSLFGFNGEEDLFITQEAPGGPDVQPIDFFWQCPPELSATPVRVRYDNDIVQLPVAKEYFIDVDILNNGLDSLDSVQVTLQIDNSPAPYDATVNYAFIPDLDYLDIEERVGLGSHFLSPGPHTVRIWTSLPNGQTDMLLEDDTIVSTITIMDTMRLDSVNRQHCDDFESTDSEIWIAANPYTLSQEGVSFEQGTPAGTVINTANSGTNVWATNLDGNYPNSDASILLSPFFLLETDSCYQVSFNHNYLIIDSLHDGGTMQVLNENYLTSSSYDNSNWDIIGNSRGDSLIISVFDTISLNPLVIDTVLVDSNIIQTNWYNTLHILSITDNSQNSGWTGNSHGWEYSQNRLLRNTGPDYYTALRWRFESDGIGNDEGWAIDDFCVETIDPVFCIFVGLSETGIDQDQIYLAQNIPNPAQNRTSIPYYVPNSGQMRFEVFNMVGQAVFAQENFVPKGDGVIDLDLSSYSTGIYYYSMIVDGVRITKKMIVTK